MGKTSTYIVGPTYTSALNIFRCDGSTLPLAVKGHRASGTLNGGLGSEVGKG